MIVAVLDTGAGTVHFDDCPIDDVSGRVAHRHERLAVAGEPGGETIR